MGLSLLKSWRRMVLTGGLGNWGLGVKGVGAGSWKLEDRGGVLDVK